MTEPLRFHLHVAPRSTTVRPSTPTVGIKTNPVSTVIIAGVPGRKGDQGTPGTGVPVFAEAPMGVRDGVNTVFTTALDFRADSTALYLNGLREDEYTETDNNEITLDDPPLPGDKLRIDYMIA